MFAVSLYTAQSDPSQPKEDAAQKWSRVSHTYQTLKTVSYNRVYNEPRTWSDASKTCAKDGSHLLIINPPAEATELKQYLDSTVETYIVGFHDLFDERRFETAQCTRHATSAAVVRSDLRLQLRAAMMYIVSEELSE